MTGLEKILKAIEEEAASNAQEIVKQADKEAEDILQSAKQEAERKCVEIAAKSEAEVKDILDRAASAAQLMEKKFKLETKQRIIKRVILNAESSITKLESKEYVEIILRMIKKYAHGKQGIIFFSEKDKKRLPMDFVVMLNNVLAEIPGAVLVVAEEDAAINGGFILKYGDVEENCSFEALFSTAKDDLQEMVNEFLFNGAEQFNQSAAQSMTGER